MGVATCGKTPFSGPLLIRNRCPDTSSKASLWMKAQKEGALHTRASFGKFRRFHIQLDSDLLPREQLERQAKFDFSTEYEA